MTFKIIIVRAAGVGKYISYTQLIMRTTYVYIQILRQASAVSDKDRPDCFTPSSLIHTARPWKLESNLGVQIKTTFLFWCKGNFTAF